MATSDIIKSNIINKMLIMAINVEYAQKSHTVIHKITNTLNTAHCAQLTVQSHH